MHNHLCCAALFAASIVAIGAVIAFLKSKLSLARRNTKKINSPDHWYIYFAVSFLLVLIYLVLLGTFSTPTYFPRVWM